MAEGVAERLDSEWPPIVAAKLAVPPTPSWAIARPRLLARLDTAARRRLTVVTGPAGTGKSVLLADWVRRTRRRHRVGPGRSTDHSGHIAPVADVAWLDVDRLDADPDRLWTHVAVALSRSRAGCLSALRRRARARVRFDNVADVLATSRVPTILALDGFDRLPPGPALDSVVALLRSRVPVRVILATRSAPDLPLARLRLDDELAEIGPADLAFTAAEAHALWHHRGIASTDAAFTAERARSAWERADGWAAGLSRESAEIRELVRQEIVGPFPSAYRQCLAELSLADPVPPDLARVLTARSEVGAVLEAAVRSHLLRRLDDGRYAWWRPVRDVLRHDAATMDGAGLADRHRRAASWYAARGRPTAAVRHAIAAGPAFAARLGADLAIELVLRRDDPTALADLAELAERLPIVDAFADPEAAAVLVAAAAARGDGSGVAAYADLLRAGMGALEEPRATRRRALLGLGLVVVARSGPDVAALATAGTELLSEVDAAVPGLVDPRVRAVAVEALGCAHLWAGRFAEAEPLLTGPVLVDPLLSDPRARFGLAVLHCLRGRVREAADVVAGRSDELARAVLAVTSQIAGDGRPARRFLASSCTSPGLDGIAMMAIRATLLSGGYGYSDPDPVRARALLAEVHGDPPPLLRGWLALADAELQLAQARPVHALTILSGLSYARDWPLAPAVRIMAARAYLASAAPARAASLVAPVMEWPDVGPALLVEAWLVSALAADALGHDGAVAIALGQAAARSDGIVAPWRNRDARLVELLRRHRDLIGDRAQREPAVRPGGNHPPVEPVTARENVVLRYLPTLLTLADIARELSVSPNTVKSHLRHIYRKLAVNNRRDAVRQARRLGLLPG